MRRDFVIFDVSGDLAHFRRQYAITTALTYAVPPRTALCGLVGAVLGLPKNESLAAFGDDKAIFGLQIVKPVKTGHVSINLVDTKDNPTFRLKAVNPRTTMRYEVIQEPKFRIMFSHPDLGPKLADLLESGESVYTPCPGLAWMIGWFEGQYREKGELVKGDPPDLARMHYRGSEAQSMVQCQGSCCSQFDHKASRNTPSAKRVFCRIQKSTTFV